MNERREKIVVVGAGGHGRVCADIAFAQGFDVAGFVDSGDVPGVVNDIPVVARHVSELLTCLPPSVASLFIAIGNNTTRSRICLEAESLGYNMPVLRHPNTWVSPTVAVGAGTVLMPGVIVNANTSIGRYCILNTSCSLDHNNVLEDAVQICPGVRSAGNVHFGTLAFIGTGAVLIPSVKIGAGAVVGAGSVVIKDIAAGSRVVGNPARKVTVRS
jgi:sugar O-acyltransferase (sialic acid O-acetyltransferase NeuD family)